MTWRIERAVDHPLFLTGALLHEVRVVFLTAESICNDERKGGVHQPSIAPAVECIVAVDQFLLRQRRQVPCHYLVDALNRRHRRESPATPCPQ